MQEFFNPPVHIWQFKPCPKVKNLIKRKTKTTTKINERMKMKETGKYRRNEIEGDTTSQME